MSQDWTPPPPSGTSASVPNYLVLAIISLFCCTPLGIVAIIFAAQVNGKVAAGDIAGATDASKKAKMFSYISIGLGLAGILCYVLFILVMGIGMGIAGSTTNTY
ncbi:MAG: CD225/dispanin family protein [Acidobacteria bacterium]|nr:CD225/dispanin family protein [Acidobacteriota bacterium]MCA1627807.1 CD225/dispanin family protein [Acidobacteriota bacterium]